MNEILVTMVSTAFVCIGGSAFVFFRYYRKIQLNMEQMLIALDRAVGGRRPHANWDETMDSAIAERLERIVRITAMQREQAESERDLVKSLISDISHQVRTPLSNIMLYVGLLKEADLNPQAGQLTDKVMQNCDKLEFFLKELVKSSYAEQELIAIHPKRTGADELVDIACQSVELAAMKKGIQIRKKMAEETIPLDCLADRKWTIEALVNILENAVKYSPDQSVVEIEVIKYEAFICIEIRDHGIGIPEAEQGKVFERFYRSERVKQQPGFGIGLYLAREVMSKQGGYIKIRSQVDKGTAVSVYLSRYGIS